MYYHQTDPLMSTVIDRVYNHNRPAKWVRLSTAFDGNPQAYKRLYELI